MNKKGQTLVIFIILLPVLLIVSAFVIDMGLIAYQNVHLKEVTKTVLKDTQDVNEIKELLQKNNIPVENLVIEKNNQELLIKNEYEVNSIFGLLVGIKTYPVKLELKMIEKKLVFE